jgi:hypothetical protein
VAPIDWQLAKHRIIAALHNAKSLGATQHDIYRHDQAQKIIHRHSPTFTERPEKHFAIATDPIGYYQHPRICQLESR